MNTSSNRKLHQLTLKASQVSAASIAKSQGKTVREQYTEDGELMLDPAVLLDYRKQDFRLITECHLGGKGIEHIHPNIQSFVNLETLWLNGNRLTRVDNLLPPIREHKCTDGLEGCVRLKRLYLSDNRISTLNGDIMRLKYLEVLLLANNNLSNMEGISYQLGHLRFLKQLELHGNPLAEEQNYRLYFVQHHPSVILFDMLSVTDNERAEAAQTFPLHGASGGPLSSTAPVGFGTHRPPKRMVAKAGLISPSVDILEGRVKHLKLQEAAQLEYEETKEESNYERRMDRRRMFHSLWGTKEPSAVSQGKGDRPGMSHLFDYDGATAAPGTEAARKLKQAEMRAVAGLDDPASSINKLLDLALEIERCENAERKAELEVKLGKMKSKLFPERFGDGFAAALQKQNVANATETQKEYDEKLLQIIYNAEEMGTLQRLFENEKLTIGDVQSMRKLLQVPLEEQPFNNFIANKLKAYAPPTTTLIGQKVRDIPPLYLRESLVAIGSYVPFIVERSEQYRIQSIDDLGAKGKAEKPTLKKKKKGAETPTTPAPAASPTTPAAGKGKRATPAGGKRRGATPTAVTPPLGAGGAPHLSGGEAAAVSCLKKMNFLTDHKAMVERQVRNEGRMLAPYIEEQDRLGSAFREHFSRAKGESGRSNLQQI